mmetsp:Transcript_32051/g.57480  ORF Transcript_32051/g.57480 Transcript_32051/m.57480 type:complete len:300 (-) Transcript_32051:151-1050(-)
MPYQHGLDQVLRVLRHVLPISRTEVIASCSYFVQHLCIRVAVEGRVAAQHHVHDDATAPDVGLLVVLAGQNLRSHVVWSSSFGGERLPSLELAGKPEVDDLQRILLDGLVAREEEVLWLEIPVANVVLVHVVDSADDLLHEDRSVDFRKVPVLNDAIEKLATPAKLHAEVDVPVVLKCFVKLDDVWVVHHLHDGNLLLETLHVLHGSLGNCLHSTDRACGLVLGLAHRAVRALSQLFLIQGIEICDFPSVVDDELSTTDASLFDLLSRHLACFLCGLRRGCPIGFFGSGAAHGCKSKQV